MKTMRELRESLMHYTDGTLSREFEDWEATGADEMNQLAERCRQTSKITRVRDRLTNLRELVTICREALLNSDLSAINILVSNVLHFHVEDQINLIDEELKTCNQSK
jgi:hypothetical protein